MLQLSKSPISSIVFLDVVIGRVVNLVVVVISVVIGRLVNFVHVVVSVVEGPHKICAKILSMQTLVLMEIS